MYASMSAGMQLREKITACSCILLVFVGVPRSIENKRASTNSRKGPRKIADPRDAKVSMLPHEIAYGQ